MNTNIKFQVCSHEKDDFKNLKIVVLHFDGQHIILTLPNLTTDFSYDRGRSSKIKITTETEETWIKNERSTF